MIDLDFHPESPPAKLDRSGAYPEIPAVPAELEALEASVTGVFTKLAALPLPELVGDLRRTIQSVDGLVNSFDQRVGPLFVQAQSTLASADGLVGAKSQASYDLNALLKELTGAARSIRVFADYLERHPDALIRGKTGVQ